MQHPGKMAAAPKAMSVALYLNEDYDTVAKDANMKAHFARQLEGDIANALEVARWRISVADLVKVGIGFYENDV